MRTSDRWSSASSCGGASSSRTVINGLTFDGATKDPMQKAVRDALIAFMAATAEAQAEATREAQRAGIAHAKGRQSRKAIAGASRLSIASALDARARHARSAGQSVRAPSRKRRASSRQTVYRIKDNPAKAEGLLVQWSR